MSLAVVQTSSILVELKERTSSLATISLSLSNAILNDTGGVTLEAEAIVNPANEATQRIEWAPMSMKDEILKPKIKKHRGLNESLECRYCFV